MPESGMSHYCMFFYKVYIYKTQIKSREYYLNIITQERQYVCKYHHAKPNGFYKKKKKVRLKNKIRNTDSGAVSLRGAGSLLGLLSELSLGFVLCTERTCWTPPCGQKTKGGVLQPQKSSPLTKFITSWVVLYIAIWRKSQHVLGRW